MAKNVIAFGLFVNLCLYREIVSGNESNDVTVFIR